MRVLLIANTIRPGGGPAGYTYNLIAGLNKIGSPESTCRKIQAEEFTFEIFGNLSNDRSISLWNVDEHFRNRVRALLDASTRGMWRKSKKYFHRFSGEQRQARAAVDRTDLAIFQGFQDPALLEYAASQGKKTIYMPHSPTTAADEYKMACNHSNVPVNSFLYRELFQMEKRLLERASSIVFPTRHAGSEYFSSFDFINRKKILYIPSGVDLEYPEQNRGAGAQSPIRILFAGRYIDHKGFDLFNQLAERCSDLQDRFEFFSVGSGPINPSNNVKDLGWRKDIYDVINNHDLIVVPNRVAYFDLLPLEAAAIGKPILFTPAGGNIDQANILPDAACAKGIDVESLYESLVELEELIRNEPTFGIRNMATYNAFLTARHMAMRWIEALRLL